MWYFCWMFVVEYCIVSVFCIGVVVGCGDVNISVYCCFCFQFKVVGVDFVGLDVECLVSWISCQVFVFGQLINCCGDYYWYIFWYVFYVGFILFIV